MRFFYLAQIMAMVVFLSGCSDSYMRAFNKAARDFNPNEYSPVVDPVYRHPATTYNSTGSSAYESSSSTSIDCSNACAGSHHSTACRRCIAAKVKRHSELLDESIENNRNTPSSGRVVEK